MLQKLKQDLKNDLIAGLLVIIPLATTIWLTFTIASWVIDFLTRVPKQLNPFNDLNPLLISVSNLVVGFTVPLLFILFIGLMARNIAGRWLLDVGERILQAIPLAGSVYKTLKQILETILRDSNNKFRRVVLVEYPRRGIWAMAFVTGTISPGLSEQMSQPMLSVIIPTTPNPTSGWYAIVPEADVVNLSMPIEDAFKVLISGGIVGSNLMVSNVPRVASSSEQASVGHSEDETLEGDDLTPGDKPVHESHMPSEPDAPNRVIASVAGAEVSLSDCLSINELSDLDHSGLTGGA